MSIHKYIRHIFNSRAIIFYVSFFMLISCGIPTNIYLKNGITDEEGVSYYEFSSQVEEPDSFVTTLTFNLVDESLVVEDTPSICYFYSIFPSDLSDLTESSYASKILAAFNSKYSKFPGKPLSISQNDSSVLNIDYNDNKIKLYKFTYDDAGIEQTALSYLSTIKSLNYNNEYEVKFKIQNSNDGNFNFENSSLFETHDSAGNIIESDNLILTRFNKDKFKTSSIAEDDSDYLYSDYTIMNNSNSYKVIVFAAFIVQGQFSNIFWSDLHKVGTFDL